MCELRKVLRAAARDMALTLEDVFFGQKRPQVFVENRRWRFELKQGDAVDAQDSLGDWYDSVVVQVLPPLRPAPPVPAAARAGAPTEPHIQSEEADADGDGEAMDVGGGKDKAAERAAAITAMVTAGAAVGVPAGGLDEEEAEEARQPRVKVHFRCWSPEFDEAFPVTSARLQPLFAQTPDWRRALHVGMVLEVKSPRDRKWYPGRVIEVREAERRVLVASDGDVAPLASAVGGAATASTGKRERWYSFDSDEICRWAVHHKKEPPSPSPSPRGNGNGKRLAASPTSPASSSTALGSATTTTAGAAAATTGAFASAGQGHVLGSGTGAGAGRALSLSVSSSSSSSGGLGGSYYGARPRREPGVVGLSNLGNTCFMNSMLQCLGATQALTEYFLAGRHEAEVNETNPLGSKGMLVRVYVKLLQSMWLGEASPVSPVDFKRVLSQFAPQFAGYQQHDSQELGNFVLDGLHEDLNRVRNKPYVEAKDYEGVPDEALAGELWRQHLLRNDSVVVDRCQGQYKSHMTCPKCGYESVTFDPYLTITLPIPVTSMVKVAFVFHPLPAGSTPIHVAATIPSAGNAAALKTWIAANLCRPRLAVATTATAAATAVDGMAVETEAPKPGAAAPPCAPAPPPAACLNLAETVDKPPRLYKDVPDDTSLSELARPIMTLHVFELERPAAPIALPPLAPAAGGRTWGVVGRSTPSPRPFRSRSASPPRPAAAAGAGGSNGGSNSNSEGPAALVTLQVAKVSPRYIRSNNYDRMGMPVRFALPMGPATTNAAVHTRVWAALQPCLKDDEPLAEGKRPYALMIGNSHAGTMDGAAVPDDAEPFNFRALQHKTLFAVFEAADFMDHVDKDRLEQVDSHPSVRRDSLGDSSGAGGAGRRKAIDLRQCLEKFAERELLGADDLWKCGRCNERLQAYKKMVSSLVLLT